jgi:NAD(P)-dependent dehydrogenase (short-subunit alcohol dehydrogenase family)
MENTKILQGKVLLATGASRRIGQAIAREAAMQGAMVAFTYLSSVEQGQALEAELAALGSKARGYRSDASDFTQAEQLINNLLADFGTLDVLVNKAGNIGFSKSVALKLGSRNIRCNVIAPGFFETEMTAQLEEKVVSDQAAAIPMKRAGKSEEVASVLSFLAYDMSSYISGQVLEKNGVMNT